MVQALALRGPTAKFLTLILSLLSWPRLMERSLLAAPPPQQRVVPSDTKNNKPASRRDRSIKPVAAVSKAIPVDQTGTTRTTTPASSDTLNGPEVNEATSWSEIVRSVLLTAIPDKYEDCKHWDRRREVFDGVRVQQRGVHLQVTERRKLVNDGAWYKYRIELPNPDQRLQLTFGEIHTEGAGAFSCTVHVVVKPRCTAWFEQWVLGVKGLNLKVVSDATVHMYATCRLAIRAEFRPNSLLPDVVLEPSLVSLKLRLTDIETHRIGVIGGDVAEQLGNGSRRFLADLLKDREAKVLKKVNAAIAKKRDTLRLSPSFGGAKSNDHKPTVAPVN